MKKTLRFAIVPVLGGMLFWSQAATPAAAADPDEVMSNIVNYVPNRIHDIIDVFKLDLSWGNGFGVDARVTRVLAVGASMYDGVNRAGLNMASLSVWSESNDDVGVSILGFEFGGGLPLDRDAYEVGLTVHAVVGAEAGFSVMGVLDALTGFFLVDLEEDDWNPFG